MIVCDDEVSDLDAEVVDFSWYGANLLGNCLYDSSICGDAIMIEIFLDEDLFFAGRVFHKMKMIYESVFYRLA
jgi:hypothetical protein